jgi:hypothetical protein
MAKAPFCVDALVAPAGAACEMMSGTPLEIVTRLEARGMKHSLGAGRDGPYPLSRLSVRFVTRIPKLLQRRIFSPKPDF